LDLKGFFKPKNVAIIGASSHHEKIGFSLVKNILDGGFSGRIFPINPTAEDILGLKCYKSILETPAPADLVVIAVPAKAVPEVLKECGKARVKYAIIITAGFAEIGDGGIDLQKETMKIAADHNIRILGPNCLGVIDPVNKINASFATNMPKKRNIAVVSQSGATCTAILDWANSNGIGFSHFVSLGNKADLNENDFLEYYLNDDNTDVVIGYLESISDPERFLEIAKKLTHKKPFVLLKAGRSTLGSNAAGSHTGALACDDSVIEAVFQETGIIRAETLQDMFELATIFSDLNLPKKNELLIMTNAGGPAVMAIDSVASSKNLDQFHLNSNQKEILSKVLPVGASVNNPLDLLGDATSRTFELAFKVLKGKDDSPLKLIILTPQSNTDSNNIAKIIVENSNKNVVVVMIGGGKFEEAEALLRKHRIPVFLYPERAVYALDKLCFYSEFIHKKRRKETYDKTDKKLADRILKTYKMLDDADLAKVLMAYNIPMANSKLTTNARAAAEFASQVGYPVVLKITSPDILHKTEIGAVKLGVENEASLLTSYQEVLRNAKKHHPKATILGVTVYKMVRSTVEVAIGAKRDPLFGPVIMFGLGGIYIEVFKDFKLRLAPVSNEEAMDMIKGIRSHEMLDGYRNGAKFDFEALAKAISGLSMLMNDFPQIMEIDINPIRVNTDHHGIIALDCKMIFKKD
jgi:acetyltransferase